MSRIFSYCFPLATN